MVCRGGSEAFASKDGGGRSLKDGTAWTQELGKRIVLDDDDVGSGGRGSADIAEDDAERMGGGRSDETEEEEATD